MEFAAAAGQILRRLRTDRGLTLHGVQDLSKGEFKASALSGYERGERSISLEKFHELTALYTVPADVALTQVLALLGEKKAPDSVVDITDASIDLTDSEMVAHQHREG